MHKLVILLGTLKNRNPNKGCLAVWWSVFPSDDFPSAASTSGAPQKIWTMKSRGKPGKFLLQFKKNPTSTPTSTGTTEKHTHTHLPWGKNHLSEFHHLKERRRSFSNITQQIWKTNHAGGSDRAFISSYGAGEIFGRILQAGRERNSETTKPGCRHCRMPGFVILVFFFGRNPVLEIHDSMIS